MGNNAPLVKQELPHVPSKVPSKGLVSCGYNTLDVLKCCSVTDLPSACVTIGHELQMVKSWHSGCCEA